MHGTCCLFHCNLKTEKEQGPALVRSRLLLEHGLGHVFRGGKIEGKESSFLPSIFPLQNLVSMERRELVH